MTKGIFIHLLVTVVFLICVMWIYSDVELDVESKSIVCFVFFALHAITAIAMGAKKDLTGRNLYTEKLFK